MVSSHIKQATAASANTTDKPLLKWRIELALLPLELPCADVDVDSAADDDTVPLVEELELDEGGATAESALTVDHEAAELAALLPWVYGRKETAPLLVS